MLKFGKKAAKRSRKTLFLANYLHTSAIAYPAVKAWERPIDYLMLANDQIGCCTISGFYHLRMNMQAVANAGTPLVVTDQEVISDYSAITGYNPNDPSTDNGANCIDVLNWYRQKGTIAGYVALDQGNIEQIKIGTFLFGGAYIGFNVPQSMVDQLNNGQDPDWSYSPSDKASGEGHCVTPVGYGRDGLAVISWGKVYRTSWDFWNAWVDEAYSIVSKDWIKASGVSPTGLDLNGLLADMANV